MGSGSQSITPRERVAGKWQVPLMALSAALFATAMVALRPHTPYPSVKSWIEQIASLKRGVLLPEAAHLARSVLGDHHFEPAELGPVYATLADVLFRMESRRSERDSKKIAKILALYAQADLLGHPRDGDALFQEGQVYEWLGQPRNALEHYNRSLREKPSDPLLVRKRALSLQLFTLKTPRPELHTMLDELLAQAQTRPEILDWTLNQKVQLLVDVDQLAEAEQILATYRSFVEGTSYEAGVSFLTGLLQYKNGKFDQAELTLRDLRSKLRSRGDIHARSGWLLGKVILADDGPQRPLEAISFFQDVLEAHPVGEFVTASQLGMAEALTDLERFDEALLAYENVLQGLKSIPQTHLINRRVVRTSLTVRSRMLRQSHRFDEALSYQQFATDLVGLDDQKTRVFFLLDLATEKASLAWRKKEQSGAERQAGQSERAQALVHRGRELFLSAAEDYLELSELKLADEPQAAQAVWQAAMMFDSAGQRARTIALLEGFLVDRPASNQIPTVLFKLGQAYQASGDFEKASEVYERCIGDHPRTTPAYESHVPLADCYVMLGPEHSGKAETTLLNVLEEPPEEANRFTPESAIYRDAVFKLGALYSRGQRYEDAIQWLDEALARYPQDARQPRAAFLLADAYRQSGLALAEVGTDMSNALRREQLHREEQVRLRRAETLFGQVITMLSRESVDGLLPMQELQLELSYAYRADCAFDLGEYDRAAGLYEEVIRFADEDPAALAAYVQLISAYESVGRVSEIGPALRRAQWLVTRIDAEKYESKPLLNTPRKWQTLLAWIDETGDHEPQ